jgi:hypothetical protein
MSTIESLRKKVRDMGHVLALIEMRGLKGSDYLPRRLAHSLLLSQLYELEKRV